MLSVLTKTFRIKAAIVLAVLYVLCILAPSVAFAFSDNPAVAHCLTEGHVGPHDHGGKVHVPLYFQEGPLLEGSTEVPVNSKDSTTFWRRYRNTDHHPTYRV